MKIMWIVIFEFYLLFLCHILRILIREDPLLICLLTRLLEEYEVIRNFLFQTKTLWETL